MLNRKVKVEGLRAIELIKQVRFQLARPGYKWTVTEGLVNLGMAITLDADLVEPIKALTHIKQSYIY